MFTSGPASKYRPTPPMMLTKAQVVDVVVARAVEHDQVVEVERDDLIRRHQRGRPAEAAVLRRPRGAHHVAAE